MSCQCYEIGGPFIAEDPDCPAHGTEAQAARAEQETEMEALRAEILELRGTVSTLRSEVSRLQAFADRYHASNSQYDRGWPLTTGRQQTDAWRK
jgi:hypothetical protein